jgi:hypothetical protein
LASTASTTRWTSIRASSRVKSLRAPARRDLLRASHDPKKR